MAREVGTVLEAAWVNGGQTLDITHIRKGMKGAIPMLKAAALLSVNKCSAVLEAKMKTI